MSEDPATETPLIDLLRDIPSDYRGEWPIQWAEDGTPTGHAIYPIGQLAHKTADRIAELEKDKAELVAVLEDILAELETHTRNPRPT